MRVAKLFVLLFNIPFFLNAQGNVNNHGKPLKFLIGTEYRITPIYGATILSESASFTDIDIQNSGTAFNLGLEYEILKNLSAGFSNSFRYDMIIAPTQENNKGINVGATDYKIIVDYHLYFAYYFKVFSKGDVFASAGISFLNTNTSFSVKEVDDIGERYYLSDFSYFANRISIGFRSLKSRVYLGMNYSRTTDYFNTTTSFIIPHIGFCYDLARL